MPTGGIAQSKCKEVSDSLLKLELTSVDYQFVPPTNCTEFSKEKMVYGPGKISIGNVLFEKFIPGYKILSSSVFMTPEDAIYGAGFGFPTEGIGNFNFIMSVGAHPEKAKIFNRTTSYGTNNFIKPINIDRNEAFGNSALMFMRYGERNTMIGSIAGQYLGSTDPLGDGHNWFGTDESNGYSPGDHSWDWQGLERANPGIGIKIAKEKIYAETSEDCSRNVGVGRDAMNLAVKNRNCTAIGYRALCNSFVINNSVAVGADAMMNGVFHGNSVAVGYSAAVNWQEGDHNTVIGNMTGSGIIKGSHNTLLGAHAGKNAKVLNDCIFIGRLSGNKAIAGDENPSNILSIGNEIPGISSPIISGDMVKKNLGVNISPSEIAGTFHIKGGDAESNIIAPRQEADGLIIENTNDSGLTIRSGNDGTGNIDFSSVTVPNAATIYYSHASAEMRFRVNSIDCWKINSTSISPVLDNKFSFGTPANRPTQIFSANSPIITSDATKKNTPREINDAEIAAFNTILRLPGVWQWLDKVHNEGDNARLHSGPTVQAAIAIMTAHGLDWSKYSCFCYEKWEAQTEELWGSRITPKKVNCDDGRTCLVNHLEKYKTGKVNVIIEAGELYSFRKEELLWWCVRALASQVDNHENRIGELERQIKKTSNY